MPDLGILIVTLKRRRPYMARLMRRLEPQLSPRVEVFTLEDEGAESIGVKRQRLLISSEVDACSRVCFFDDDDLPSGDYCASILDAIDGKLVGPNGRAWPDPDVVGFRLRYYEDGRPRGTSVHSLEMNPYKRWATARHPRTREKIHYRTPNHLNPVRLEMARAVGFPDRMTGEDAEFSRGLYKKFPQMTEAFIDRLIYDYLYRTPRLRKESEDLQIEDVSC